MRYIIVPLGASNVAWFMYVTLCQRARRRG
jgi:hypothetical protein